jgi:heme o synthase
MVRDYLILFKVRLCGMVLITTAVGYLVASSGSLDWGRLLLVLVGTALAAFGANALNQWLERGPDALMHRTRHRPLPAGRMSSRRALAAGLAVSSAGPLVLWFGAGRLPAVLALATILLYVLVYTPLKRRSTLNTAVGAVSGALPPVIGWAGAGHGLGLGAGLLFTLLFLWQMPHFFALAWMYRDDYARGGYKMLPVLDPHGRLTFPVAAVFALLLLPLGLIVTVAGLAGIWFALGSLALGTWWSVLSLRLARSGSDRDARRVFLASLAYLPLVLGLMVIDRGPLAGQNVALARVVEEAR